MLAVVGVVLPEARSRHHRILNRPVSTYINFLGGFVFIFVYHLVFCDQSERPCGVYLGISAEDFATKINVVSNPKLIYIEMGLIWFIFCQILGDYYGQFD